MSTSILLINPKYPHNVGGAVRALSCFGEGSVYWAGDRIDLGNRLPREERMREYRDVHWEQLSDSVRPISQAKRLLEDPTPVAIELLPGSESLHTFEHPEHALYVFGPEDGSLPAGIRRECHRFVTIPAKHCLNLAAAVYLTLYDRVFKRWQEGIEPIPELDEARGWWHSPALEEIGHG